MTTKMKGYNNNPERANKPGQRFCMDFGFVRGKEILQPKASENFTENHHQPILTSKDGFNCYLLVVDEYSRYLWIFLFASKSPPVDTVTKFLNTHGLSSGPKWIRTDQGGELAKSTKFRKCINDAKYTLETTAPGFSFQNTIAERPHYTLADMMQTMLSDANLSSTY